MSEHKPKPALELGLFSERGFEMGSSIPALMLIDERADAVPD